MNVRKLTLFSSASVLVLAGLSSAQDPLLANRFDGPNIAVKIHSAIAALPPTGGSIAVQPGRYAGIPLGITIDKPVHLHCSTKGHRLRRTCELNFNSGLTGITLATGSDGTLIDGFYLSSNASAGEEFDGIRITDSTRPQLKHIIVDGFGRNGIRTDSSRGGNVNLWSYEDVRAFNNKGDGFFWIGRNTNAGLCLMCDASNNAGHGFHLSSGSATYENRFIACHAADNGGDQFRVENDNNYFLDPYIESSEGRFVFTPGSDNNRLFAAAGAGGIIVNEGGLSNWIFYKNASNLPAFNSLTVDNRVFSGSGLKHQRVSTGSCGPSGCQVTLTWTSAFPDNNYTAVCSIQDTTKRSEASGLRFARINTVSAESVVVDVDNLSASAITGKLECIAMHD